MDQQYLSKEGLEKLKAELLFRAGDERKAISLRIKEAKEQGDLSENAEYSEAKDAQSKNEGRIQELGVLLDNAVLIAEGDHGGTVEVGSRIKVKAGTNSHEYTIVGAAESNPLQGYISNESPLGSAFLGRKEGESVNVVTPRGDVQYKILEVK